MHLFLSISLFLSCFGNNQNIEFNAKNNILIDGYDPVSYFTQYPKKGLDQFTLIHSGVAVKFSSQSNLDLFKKKPDKYLPKYGGWCAYAMAKDGEKVTINPKTYQIHEGKLYLFYNSWGTNTLKLWKKEGPKLLKEQADHHWKAMTSF